MCLCLMNAAFFRLCKTQISIMELILEVKHISNIDVSTIYITSFVKKLKTGVAKWKHWFHVRASYLYIYSNLLWDLKRKYKSHSFYIISPPSLLVRLKRPERMQMMWKHKNKHCKYIFQDKRDHSPIFQFIWLTNYQWKRGEVFCESKY